MGTANERLNILINVLQKDAEKNLSNLQNQLLGIGTAYLSWQGAKEVISWTIGAAAESEQAWAAVGNAIRNIGESVDSQLPVVQKFADEIRKKYGIADETVGNMVGRMLPFLRSTQEAMYATGIAINYAIQRQVDYSTAVDLISKAHEGQVTQLSRIGAKFTEGASDAQKYQEALDFMARLGIGAADRQAQTLTGSLNRMKESWNELGESVGKFLAETAKLPAVFNALSWAIDNIGNGAKVAWAALTGGPGKVHDALIEIGLDMLATGGSMEVMSGKAVKVAESFALTEKQIEEADKAFNELVEDISNMYVPTTGNEDTYMANARVQNEVATRHRVEAVWQGSRNAQWREWQKLYERQGEFYIGVNQRMIRRSQSDWERFKKDFHLIGKAMAAGLEASFASAGNYIANTLGDTFDASRLRLNEIWKAMAGDFIRYFIDSAIASIAGKFLGFLGKLFDNPVNDRMANRQGFDFGTHFARGVNDAMAAMAIPALSGAGTQTPGSPVIVIAGGGSVDMSAIYKQVERAANSKEISVVTRQTLAEAMRSVTAYGRS